MDSNQSCWHASNPTVSQQANLRTMRKKIENSCCLAEQTNINDIQAVLQDDDIASITVCHDSDEEVSNSILDASLISNDDNASNAMDNTDSTDSNDTDNSNFSRPYVPFSVEELSLVRTLSLWSNHNVRVVGNISASLDYNLWSLVSIGEEGGPFSIIIDMRLVQFFPTENSPVQVFGEIQMTKNNPAPRILAKFFRDFSSVDIFNHNKGIEELKKFIPHFIGKRNSQSRMLDDSE